MRILLIKPPTGETYKSLKSITPEYPPLSLAYIASYLENHDFEVKILDLGVEHLDTNKLLRFVDKFSPQIIGFTSTTPTIMKVYELINTLRFEFPDIKYVLGGSHATALPEEALKHVDIVIRGEGEETFLEVVKAIKTRKQIDNIKGISFKKNKKVFHNSDRALIANLDSIPLPAWHLLDLKKYHYFGAKRHPIASVFTSRGCPYNCSFCNKNIFSRKIRLRSNENIMKEVDLLVNQFGVKEIHISDDVFNINKKKTIDLCKNIQKRNYDLNFFPHNGVRVSSIDKQVLDAFWDAGFYGLAFGVESGDQKVLDYNSKGIKIAEIKKAFKLTKNYDFTTWGFFILGLPGETKTSAMKTAKLAIELNPDIAKFSILVPFPGTRTYDLLKGRLKTHDWSQFGLWQKPVFEPEHMTSQELLDIYKQATRKFYFRPKKIFQFTKEGLKDWNKMKEYSKAGLGLLKMTNS